MAIQAHHLNYFPSQVTQNTYQTNPSSLMNNVNVQMDFGLPLSGTTTTESLLPFYNSLLVDWPPEPFDTMKAESGVTYNNNVNNNNISSSGSRKRSRDSFATNLYDSRQKLCRNSSVSFLGEDISLQIQQQQLEMDRLIAQHMEKVRLVMLQRRKEHSRRVVAAIGEKIMKRLKEKEEEIEKIGKFNWLLEERVNALFLENQMWRNLAETNEATANALRSNLEQVLCHQVKQEEEKALVGEDDAESCCGSSDDTSGSSSRWWCRKCGKEEASVVLLPCRHLCVCTFCAPSLERCPICEFNNSGSVHVNLS